MLINQCPMINVQFSMFNVQVKVTRRGSNAQMKTIEAKLDKRVSLLYGDTKKGVDEKREAFITRSESRRGSMMPESRRGSVRPVKVRC